MKSLTDIRDLQKTILEDCGKSAKNEERYCRLCGKREKRSVCGYGPAGWDKYSVKDATDAEKEAAAEDAGIVEEETLHEVAPPSAKAERMVKHIKKGYSKDGKLTDKEKSIAYATAGSITTKKKKSNTLEIIKDLCMPPTPILLRSEKNWDWTKELPGLRSQVKIKKEGSMKKDASLMREKILEATLRHHRRRLEIPVGHPSVLE